MSRRHMVDLVFYVPRGIQWHTSRDRDNPKHRSNNDLRHCASHPMMLCAPLARLGAHWFPDPTKSVPMRHCPPTSGLSTSTLPLISNPSRSLTLSPWETRNTFMTRSAENRIIFMSANHPTCAPFQKTDHWITSLLLKYLKPARIMMLHWMLLPLIIWDEGSSNDMSKCTSMWMQIFSLFVSLIYHPLQDSCKSPII